LDDLAEFQRDGGRGSDFVVPVEFGDLGVVSAGDLVAGGYGKGKEGERGQYE
jgi:hypothetical protein